MNKNSVKIIAIGIMSLMLLACSHKNLNYQLDPDFSQLATMFKSKEIIYVNIIDERQSNQALATGSLITADMADKDALKEKIIQYLKDHQYKIINRKLLADLGLEIEILNLQLVFEDGVFKSKLSAKSELKVTLHKKSQNWSKRYKATRIQEVASPVNHLDTTGVMNQMLTKQFESIFTDTEMTQFISN